MIRIKKFHLILKRYFCEKSKATPFSKDFLKNLAQNSHMDRIKEVNEEKNHEFFENKNNILDLKKNPKKKILEKDKNLIINEEAVFLDKNKNILKTRFGNFKIPSHLKNKYKDKISNIYYLGNSTNINYIKRIFKNDKKALMFFSPDLNFTVMRRIFESSSKRIKSIYFDEKKLQKNFKDFNLDNLSNNDKKKIYNDSVRKILDLRFFLDRMVICVNTDFSLKCDSGAPDIKESLGNYIFNVEKKNVFLNKNLEKKNEILISKDNYRIEDENNDINGEFEKQNIFQSSEDDFYKYDLIMPLSKVLKLHSLQNMMEKGIMYDFLHNLKDPENVDRKKEVLNTKIFKDKYNFEKDKNYHFEDLENELGSEKNTNIISKYRIFNYYNVFPPTNKILYKFIFNQLKKNQNFLKSKKNFLDIGSGSGILSVLYRKAVQNRKTKFYSLDKNPDAVKNTLMNCGLIKLDVTAENFDILDYNIIIPNKKNLKENDLKSKKNLQNKNIKKKDVFPDKKFEFIISNPPWIIAKPINNQDSGNYDYKGKLIKKIFQFVAEKLDKEKGDFWLIYSDLSQNCGLVSENFIYDMARENGLIVKEVNSCPNEYFSHKLNTELDLIKQKSNNLIYQITF